ncbi:MAG: hypothetical protein K0R15_336 [Clostridiales bacterium]|jgi:hypothetical protein|nr:hypothetical protein [Clostridiales bacterium]
MSIIYDIMQSVNSDFSFKKGKGCMQVASTISEFFREKITALIDLSKAEDSFAKRKEQKNILELISAFMGNLLRVIDF